MKKTCKILWITMALALITNTNLSRAEETQPETVSQQFENLFDKIEVVESGAYAAPVFKRSGFDDESMHMVGIRGAWIANHKWGFGLAGYTRLTALSPFGDDSYSYNPKFTTNDEFFFLYGLSYGGVVAEHSFTPHKLIHIKASNLLGMGGFTTRARNSHPSESNGLAYEGIRFFAALEPELTAMINISQNVRTGLSAGYRIFMGDKYSHAMNGWTASTLVQVGKF